MPKIASGKYDLNEDEIKPYFSLEDVRSGLYTVANKLYGITLTELNDVPVYEPDVKVYEVRMPMAHFGIVLCGLLSTRR